jgi:hypothetical protein
MKRKTRRKTITSTLTQHAHLMQPVQGLPATVQRAIARNAQTQQVTIHTPRAA